MHGSTFIVPEDWIIKINTNFYDMIQSGSQWHAGCLNQCWQLCVRRSEIYEAMKFGNTEVEVHMAWPEGRRNSLDRAFENISNWRESMVGIKFLTIIIAIGFLSTACVSDGQNTQRGAVLGGILGAVAGQAIGHNTAGTLIGAGAGALTGALIGNTHDQQVMEWRMQNRHPGYGYDTYYGPESPYSPDRPYAALPPREGSRDSWYGHDPEPPAGHWVDVPGQWVNGKWVPSHKIWVPVNPGSPYRR